MRLILSSCLVLGLLAFWSVARADGQAFSNEPYLQCFKALEPVAKPIGALVRPTERQVIELKNGQIAFVHEGKGTVGDPTGSKEPQDGFYITTNAGSEFMPWWLNGSRRFAVGPAPLTALQVMQTQPPLLKEMRVKTVDSLAKTNEQILDEVEMFTNAAKKDKSEEERKAHNASALALDVELARNNHEIVILKQIEAPVASSPIPGEVNPIFPDSSTLEKDAKSKGSVSMHNILCQWLETGGKEVQASSQEAQTSKDPKNKAQAAKEKAAYRVALNRCQYVLKTAKGQCLQAGADGTMSEVPIIDIVSDQLELLGPESASAAAPKAKQPAHYAPSSKGIKFE